MVTKPRSDDHQVLSKQLTVVTQALVAGTITPELKDWVSKTSVDDVKRVVERLEPGMWETESTEALVTCLKRAIVSLGRETIPGTRPPMAYSWAAERLFGLVEIKTDGHNDKRYDGIVGALRDQAGLLSKDKHGQRNLTSSIREKIAEKLLVLVKSPSFAGSQDDNTLPTPTRSSSGLPDVKRIGIERRAIQVLLEDTVPLILWGESGNGKSYMAIQIAENQFHGQRVAIIRGPTGFRAPFFDKDVISALKIARISPETWTLDACEVALRELIAAGNRLDLVIFDNVEPHIFEYYLANAGMPVIMTCRSRFYHENGVDLRVTEFDYEEVLSFCKSLEPADSIEQAMQFANELGRRPIALSIAFRMIRHGTYSLTELQALCRYNLTETLHQSAKLMDEPLPSAIIRIYQELLVGLHEDAMSQSLLATITWLTDSADTDVIHAHCALAKDSVLAKLTFDASIRRLESLGIIEKIGSNIIINTLTLDVVRLLTKTLAVGELNRLYAISVAPALMSIQGLDATDSLAETIVFTALHHPTAVGNASRVHSINYIAALEAAAAGLVFKWLSGGRLVGFYPLSPTTLLAWQQHAEFFRRPDGSLQLALGTVASSIKFWVDGTGVGASDAAARHFYSMAHIYNIAVDQFFIRQFDEDDASWEPTYPELIARPISNLPLRHKNVSVLSDRTLEAAGSISWTACGMLVSARVDPPSAACNACLDADPGDRFSIELIKHVADFCDFYASAENWLPRTLAHSVLGILTPGMAGVAELCLAEVAAGSGSVGAPLSAEYVEAIVLLISDRQRSANGTTLEE